MKFVRRIGVDPKVRGDSTDADDCPDIWEMDSGDFAVIGLDVTDQLGGALPLTAHRSARERIVLITRKTLTSARHDIPAS